VANEITTTSFNDVTQSAVISPILMSALAERGQLLMLPRELQSLVGQPANARTIPILDAAWGSVGDRGAGVDTEFNATQATEISNTPLTTSGVTITAAEYGIAHEITDNVQEDTIDGLDMLSAVEDQMTYVIYRAMADDFVALFAGLSQSVGTTTVDLTIAQALAAATTIRNSAAYAPDGLVYVLDNEQVANIEAGLIAGNAAAAVFALSADRLINYQPGQNRYAGGAAMNLRGSPVYTTDLTDTANTGDDVVGACFVPSSAANDQSATFGQVWKRLPNFETERHAKKRTTDLVMTTRWGVGELRDATGVKIVSDAP
jgi:hypothetical protein